MRKSERSMVRESLMYGVSLANYLIQRFSVIVLKKRSVKKERLMFKIN